MGSRVLEIEMFGFRFGEGEATCWGEIVQYVSLIVGAHRHRSGRRWQVVVDRRRGRKWFVNDNRSFVVVEERPVRVCFGVDTIRVGCGRGTVDGMVPWVVVGEVRGKVADERVQRLRAEELEGVLPLLGADERGVGDDFERGGFERPVQFAQALLLAVGEESVKVFGGARLFGDLVDVVVEGFRVLDGGRNGVVLVVELGEEVIPLQPELPIWPSPSWIIHPPSVGLWGVFRITRGWVIGVSIRSRTKKAECAENREPRTVLLRVRAEKGDFGACAGVHSHPSKRSM